jgi:hypothetical protein
MPRRRVEGHLDDCAGISGDMVRMHDPKLEKLEGDALDQRTIDRALAGVDAVIQTLGVSPTPDDLQRNAPVLYRY